MKSPLLYEYVQDWRFHSRRFREGGGLRHLAVQGRRYCAREWAIAVALLCVGLLALHYQRWLLLIAALIALAWRIRPFFAKFGLLNRELWSLRSSFRSHAPRPVRLEISEEGLRESDSGVESFAPWASVRSYRMGKQFVEIELSNNLYAYVPSLRLSPASSSWADLVITLEQRDIPQSGLTPSNTAQTSS